IQQMVKDAEAHAAEDHKAFELVSARNQGDAMVHSVKKALKDYGDKVTADEKAKIEDAIKAVEEAIKGSDKDDIDAKTQALAEASHKLAEQMYAQQGGQPGADAEQPGAAGGTHKADDDVVDAEFEEVKDK
ncbi:MAG: Hsp70 family protein, partial [Gallionellaceae bacterium]|nr:Hsp70 family protein [Gallionellaceae bacterium]